MEEEEEEEEKEVHGDEGKFDGVFRDFDLGKSENVVWLQFFAIRVGIAD